MGCRSGPDHRMGAVRGPHPASLAHWDSVLTQGRDTGHLNEWSIDENFDMVSAVWGQRVEGWMLSTVS